MIFDDYEGGAKLSKEEFKQRRGGMRVRLLNLQADVAEQGLRVLVLVMGDDRAGCEESVDRINEWFDAREIDTEVFLEPAPSEGVRPRAWRYWKALPVVGRIGVYLGAWPYDYVAASIAGASKGERAQLLGHGAEFEKLLADEGTLLLRYWVHSPKDELKGRLRKAKKGRIGWRASARDREVLEHYADIVKAGDELIESAGGLDAASSVPRGAPPWKVIEGSDARYRDQTLLEHMADEIAARLAGPTPSAPLCERVPVQPILEQVDLASTLSEDEYEERLEKLQLRLADLAYLAAERKQPSVLAFEGPDAAGKGGAIRRITKPVAARDYRVSRIAAPSTEELARPYLWRFWTRVPRRGRMAIFDRSWYGRVLVERVEGFATEAEWGRAYEEIAEFERQLVESGWIVAKFWLHIDADEQMARFEARRETLYKKHKLTEEDYRNREKWGAYEAAANEMITRTNTDRAPWHVVPANSKRFARCEVLERVCEAYEAVLDR